MWIDSHRPSICPFNQPFNHNQDYVNLSKWKICLVGFSHEVLTVFFYNMMVIECASNTVIEIRFFLRFRELLYFITSYFQPFICPMKTAQKFSSCLHWPLHFKTIKPSSQITSLYRSIFLLKIHLPHAFFVLTATFFNVAYWINFILLIVNWKWLNLNCKWPLEWRILSPFDSRYVNVFNV